MFDIITLGDSIVDTFAMIDPDCSQTKLSKNKKLLCLNYADKIGITEAGQTIGGNAANVAVGAKRLGLKSAIITELGDDTNGQFIVEQLKKEGVATDLVKKNKKNITRYSFVLNYKGERTILSYHAKRKYTFPKIPKTRCIYYTSLGESFENVQSKLIPYLKKNKDVLLASNPGSFQLRKGLSEFKKIFEVIDILIVNKEEAALLCGMKMSPKRLLKMLYDMGADTVVITDGEKGSYATNGTDFLSLATVPVPVISKTGAGDAYSTGFLSAILQHKTLDEAMCWGMANAAAVIQKIGPQTGLATKSQIHSLLGEFNAVAPKALKGKIF